jgi:putative membrane protein
MTGLSALGSALHILGVSGAIACAALRLVALRRKDIEATRFADNLNGLAALVVYGAGLWRLFGGLEKPQAFYTANPIFWTKLTLLGLLLLLEAYPQYVVLPWHIRAARKQPIEPKPGQFERMFTLAALQLPLLCGAIGCAATMARGIGLPSTVAAPAGPVASSAPQPVSALTGASAASASAPVVAGDAPAGEPPSAATQRERGHALYTRSCQTCHQADGRGLGGRLAADLTARPGVLDRDDASLLRSIAEGVRGPIGTMPAHGALLSVDEQRAVLAYVRATYGAQTTRSASVTQEPRP